MDDQQIIELLRTRQDHKGFKQLYRYFPQVQKLILSKGGSKEDARDIFQEALIVFYRKVSSGDFTLSSSIGTYLYSVCRFMWKDELKKRNKHHDVSLEDESFAAENNLEELMIRESKFRQAEHIVSTLGKRCIELLQKFYFEKLSMKIIAKKMDFTSEKIAKNQKYKCIERAKERLALVEQQKSRL